MDKVERLMNLTLALLQTTRPLTAAELRERIPGYPEGDVAFRRAFERDKESLREMGIPITLTEDRYADPPVEGYRIAEEDYYLRDPGFEPDELAALHLAASAARLDAGHGLEALWKLEGVAGGSGLDQAPWGDTADMLVELPNDPNLGPLFGAVIDRRTVTFPYRDTARTVDPYRLDFRRGRWYLTGWDHGRADVRNFRVDRIAGAVRVGGAGAFDRPPGAEAGAVAEPWQFGEEPPVTARVLVDRDQAAWVRQNLAGSATFTDQPDGSVIAEVVVTNWPAFRSYVLTFLEHAEVLGPPALRDDVIAWLEHVAAPGAPRP